MVNILFKDGSYVSVCGSRPLSVNETDDLIEISMEKGNICSIEKNSVENMVVSYNYGADGNSGRVVGF